MGRACKHGGERLRATIALRVGSLAGGRRRSVVRSPMLCRSAELAPWASTSAAGSDGRLGLQFNIRIVERSSALWQLGSATQFRHIAPTITCNKLTDESEIISYCGAAVRNKVTNVKTAIISATLGMVWCPSYPLVLDRNRCDQVVAAGIGSGRQLSMLRPSD
jgi:hypothetical protein